MNRTIARMQEKVAAMQSGPASIREISSSKQEIPAPMHKPVVTVAGISCSGAAFRAARAGARCNGHKKSRIAAALKG
jgi:hypothetical protein